MHVQKASNGAALPASCLSPIEPTQISPSPPPPCFNELLFNKLL